MFIFQFQRHLIFLRRVDKKYLYAIFSTNLQKLFCCFCSNPLILKAFRGFCFIFSQNRHRSAIQHSYKKKIFKIKIRIFRRNLYIFVKFRNKIQTKKRNRSNICANTPSCNPGRSPARKRMKFDFVWSSTLCKIINIPLLQILWR